MNLQLFKVQKTASILIFEVDIFAFMCTGETEMCLFILSRMFQDLLAEMERFQTPGSSSIELGNKLFFF